MVSSKSANQTPAVDWNGRDKTTALSDSAMKEANKKRSFRTPKQTAGARDVIRLSKPHAYSS